MENQHRGNKLWIEMKDGEEVITAINDFFTEHSSYFCEGELEPLSIITNGTCWIITFLQSHIWSSEDDEREEIEYSETTFEPLPEDWAEGEELKEDLETFLLREIGKRLNQLAKLSFLMNVLDLPIFQSPEKYTDWTPEQLQAETDKMMKLHKQWAKEYSEGRQE